MFGRLNHIGVAVPSVDDALARFRALFGEAAVGIPFDLPDHGVRVAFVQTGNSELELLSPLGAASSLHAFLGKTPAGGQHHLCFEVPDIAVAVADCTALGLRVLGPARRGAHGTPVVFLHPRDMGGVLTELMEAPHAHV